MSTSFFPNRPDATRGLARSRVSEGSGRCVSGCACVKSRGESAGDKRFSGSPSARVSRGGGEFFNELSLLFFAMGAKLSAPKVDGYADSSASMRKRYPPPTKIDHHTYLFFVTPLTYEPWANEGRDDDGLLGFVIGEHGFKFVNCRDLNEEFVHYPMSCIDSWAATGKIFRFKYRDTHHEDEVKFMQLTTPWTPALMETLGELVEMSMSKRKAQQMREEDFKELIAELDGMEEGSARRPIRQLALDDRVTRGGGVETNTVGDARRGQGQGGCGDARQAVDGGGVRADHRGVSLRQRGTGAADQARDAGDTQAGDQEEQAVAVAVGVALVEVPGAPSHRAAVGARLHRLHSEQRDFRHEGGDHPFVPELASMIIN